MQSKSLALILVLGGCAPMPVVTSEPPPACTITPARPLGGTTSPMGAPPIVHTPTGELTGAATVTSIDITADPMVLVLDVSGTSHRIEIPAWREPPAIAPSSHVWVELRGTFGTSPALTTLVLRDAENGPPNAAYARQGGNGLSEAVDFIASTFDIELTEQAVCRVPTGGQCGRGVIVRELVSGDAHATEGETMIVARTNGFAVGVSVIALSDDADTFATGDVCAIGPLVAQAIDAIVEPPGD